MSPVPTPETRSFTLREGTSDKFWRITLDGSSHSVHFGRNGTAGQNRIKGFSTDADARLSYDKLIAEKLAKGYQEAGGPAPAPAAAVIQADAKPARVKAQKKEEAEQPQPEPKPVESVGLNLKPEDWLFATWRPRVIRPRPKAPAFSIEDGQKRFTNFMTRAACHEWSWTNARLPPAMCTEEACFWIEMMLLASEFVSRNPTQRDTFTTSWDGANFARSATVDTRKVQPIEKVAHRFDESAKRYRTNAGNPARSVQFGPAEDVPLAILLPLRELYPWDQVEWFVANIDSEEKAQHHYAYAWDETFRFGMLPYLEQAQLDGLQKVVRRSLDTASVTTECDLRSALAPLLGLHKEMLEICQTQRGISLSYVFGLGSPDLVVEHYEKGVARRLSYPRDLRAWLAHTELDHLGSITDCVLDASSWDVVPLTRAFAALVSAPQAAPEFLRLCESKRHTAQGREWLDTHPRETIDGLAEIAAGSGKTATLARSLILSARRRLGELLEEVSPIAEADTIPDGLAEAFTVARRTTKAKSPGWISASELPPILLAAGRLSNADVDFVLALMASTPPRPAHPLLLALRCYATTESLDAFADALFSQWREAGMLNKNKWALLAMGSLGSDRCALRLAPLVREWPGESKHQAAIVGLECLRLIGTDTAIVQINLIAQKAKFQALKKAAQETIEAIAEDRGLTRDELEDRIVPDCGLDARGSRTFDFGPRQFQLRIGPNLKPVIIDAEGNRRSDLPKPTAKDDPVLSQAAVSDWKLSKKQVTEVVKVQIARLEHALVTQRRWTPEEFEPLLLTQPILGTLIRPLVWGVFDQAGQAIGSFRVTEDFTYADANDSVFEMPKDGSIGLLHPLHLDEATRAAWGEVLADYELIQPFPQLARPVRRLTPEEAGSDEIVRHTEAEMEPVVFASVCKRLGYFTGEVADGGSYSTYMKWLSSIGVTVVLQHSGMCIGYYDTDPVQIEKIYFVRERFGKPEWFNENLTKVPLREVDDVIISEVLSDIAALAARAGEAK